MPVTMIQECLLVQVNAMNMLVGGKEMDVEGVVGVKARWVMELAWSSFKTSDKNAVHM